MTTWREELSWAAGFFDGEGCFRLHTKNPSKGIYYSQVTINQIHPEVLERFKSAVLNNGNIRGPYVPSGTTKSGDPRKEMWNYAVTNFEGVQAVYVMLYPFLGSVKREQGKRVLELCSKPRNEFICTNGHLRTPENLTKYNQCRECMRERDRKRSPRIKK